MAIVHTHSNTNTEQAADNPIDDGIEIFIARLSTVDLPVCIVPQSQAEQVGLGDYEIQVLVEDLCDVLRRASCGYLRSEVFEERSWYR